MRVEGYSMDVYCDSDECSHYNPRHGQRFMADFAGRNRAEVNRLARRDGWIIGKRDFCPDCAAPIWRRRKKRAESAMAKREAERGRP